MKNLLLAIHWKLGLGLLLALPNFLYSQISITSQDFLNQIGSRQVVLEERNSSTTVDVGLPGANQVWDFSSMVIGDTVVAVSEFLSPDQTLSASTFPEANCVQKITTPETPGEVLSFYNFTSDFFIDLGDSTVVTGIGFDTTLVRFQSDTLAPLPISFNNTWMTFERDTTGLFPIAANISIDTTTNTVDGWGTVRLPLGDFECLRLRQDIKAINQTIVSGAVFSTSTETTIQYNWISKNSFLLARVQSQDGETNPNFTDARGFGVMDTTTASPPTSVDEHADSLVPSDFVLFQNYPNPFNPETVITYRTAQSGRVQLAVYNLIGQKVRDLVNQTQSEGTYTLSWNGTDDQGMRVSSGVYVYQLRTGQLSQTKKMIFLQ